MAASKKKNIIKFSFLLIFSFFILPFGVFASHDVVFDYVKQIGGIGNEVALSVVLDTDGNIYTTGYFSGTLDFDPGVGTSNLTAVGSRDVFVSKFDSSGNLIWVKAMGGVDQDSGNSIAVDASGNVYTAGYFLETADFDPGAGTSNLTSAGYFDIFISKLDSSGNFVWAKSVSGVDLEASKDISVDSSGNVYVTGYFESTTDFDPGVATNNLTAAGPNEVFILKLDSSGTFVWAKKVGSTGDDLANSVTIDSSNVYITGRFQGTVDFDPGAGTSNLTSAGSNDVFILKLDSSGTFVWAKKVGSTGSDQGVSMVSDSNANLYIAGNFNGTVDFDPGAGTSNLTSAGSTDIFVLQLDSAGNLIWAKNMGGASAEFTSSITIDTNGAVYTLGTFSAVADFNPGVGTSNLTPFTADIDDIFISKLDSSGNFVWVKQIGGVDYDVAYGVAVDSDESVYTVGYFYSTMDFDPGSGTVEFSTVGGSDDAFLLKLSPLTAPTLTTSHSNDTRDSIILIGDITNTGGESNTERGFNYGLGDGYGTNVTETGTYSTGTFSSTITGLTCGTTYYYRAYSINSEDTGVSDGKTFTTADCPSSGGSKSKEIKKEITPLIPEIIDDSTTTCLTNHLFNTETGKPCTTTVTPSCPITTTLKYGSKGEQVKCLQNILNERLQFSLTPDGIFGLKTKTAVIKFQTDNKLVADGVVGEKTRGLIK